MFFYTLVEFPNLLCPLVLVEATAHSLLESNSPWVGQWIWACANTRGEARNCAARNVLYNIEYFEKGTIDKPREGLPIFKSKK